MANHRYGQNCPNLGHRAVEILFEQFGKLPLKYAASKIGVAADTLKNWFDGTSKPSTDHLSRLFHRLGPTFIAYVTAPFEDAHLDMKAARIESEIKKLELARAALETSRQSVRAPKVGSSPRLGGLVAASSEEDAA